MAQESAWIMSCWTKERVTASRLLGKEQPKDILESSFCKKPEDADEVFRRIRDKAKDA